MTPESVKPQRRWMWLAWLAAALMPALLLGGIGAYAFVKARNSVKEEMLHNLTVVSGQKKHQIENWLALLDEDGRLFADHTSLADMVSERGKAKRPPVENTPEIPYRLEQIRNLRHYLNLTVFDLDGKLVAKVGAGDTEEHIAQAQAVARRGQAQFVDLHRNDSGEIELGLLAPLIDRSGQTVGTLYLARNAEDFLYPLLREWPVQHATTENLLVRRQGGEVEYISPLDALKIPPFLRRVPLDTPGLPAAVGMAGYRGIYVDGIDYRGWRVLSYLADIQQTSWVLITKIDQHEAYADINRLGWYSGAAGIVTLAASYCILFLIWRNQRLRYQLAEASAQQARRQSEARLASLVSSIQAVIWEMDTETTEMLYFSGNLERTAGFSNASVRRLADYLALIVPEDRHVLTEGDAKAMAGEPVQVAYRIRRADGQTLWMQDNYRLAVREDGGLSLRGAAFDITPRVQMEERLRESESRYKALVEHAPFGIMAVQDGCFVYANPAAAQIVGYTVSELIGMPALDTISPQSIAMVQARMANLQDGEANNLAEMELRCKDGRMVLVESNSVPIELDGHPAFLIMGHDISDRKRMETELRQMNQQLEDRVRERTEELQSVLDTTQDGFFVIDGSGRIVGTNPAACLLLGYTPEEMTALTAADIEAQRRPEEVRARFDNIIANGSGLFETRIRHKGGHFIDVETSVIYAGSKHGLFYVFNRDISLRKRLENELRETMSRLAIATEAAAIGIWDWQIPEDHLMWDERMYMLYGVQPDEFGSAYNAWICRVHPDDRQRVNQDALQTLNGHTDYRTEFRVVWPDQTVHHLMAFGKVLRGPSGQALRMVGVNIDITARKLAEQALAEKEARWHIALESHDMGVWDWNVATGRVYFSSRLLSMLGYEEGDWSPHVSEWEKRIHPEDRDSVFACLNDYFNGKSGKYAVKHRLLCKDGSYKWILDCGKGVEHNSEGKPLRMIGTHTDIDEQVRAESENLKLVSIVEASSDFIGVADVEGRVSYVNRAGRKLIGIRLDESLDGLRIPDFHPGWATQIVTGEGLPAAYGRGAWIGDTAFLSRDGREIPISQMIICHPGKDGEGKVDFIATIARDIGERKRYEQELAEKELRWHIALESHDMGVWDWLVQTGDIYYSPRWKSMLGYAEADIEPRIESWENLIHPDDKGMVLDHLQDYFNGVSPYYRAEIRLRTKAGGYRWIYTCGQVLVWSEDGKPLRMVGTHTDIDEQKRAALSLKEREETFRRLFQDSLDPAILMKKLVFVKCNQAALDMYRLPKEDFIGKTLADFSPEWQDDNQPSREVFNAMAELAVKQGSNRFDWCCRHNDGSSFFVEVSLTPIIIGGEPLIHCGLHDITERKQLTARLANAKEAAESANRAKSAFLANMSHEIRTPLNSILGKAQLIPTQKLDENTKGKIAAISKAAQHLLSIVNDILDISKIEAGKLSLHFSDFDLPDKIQGIIGLLEERAQSQGIQLLYAIDPSLPRWLRGDKLRIRQMLFNLVGNAIKFTERGTVRIRVSRLSGEGQDLRVRFEVQDTGMGISTLDQQRLFHNFEQADNQNTRQYGGTGLGLAICKRLAEEMGGEIGVESQPGKGSTFWFAIPLSEGLEQVAKRETPQAKEELAKLLIQAHRGARILLVEDNQDNQEIATELLHAVSMDVTVACNGLESVEKVSSQAFDLVLMDIQMPKMDGLEATQHIRKLPGCAGLPIIALTANAFSENVSLYLQAGINGHIAKPIIVSELYEALLHWLGQGEPGKASQVPASQGQSLPTAPIAANPDPTAADGVIRRLASIPGLDPSIGLQSLNDKTDSYLRLLVKFAKRQPEESASLRQAFDGNDWETFRRNAHTLKGLFGTLGAKPLQAKALELQQASSETPDREALRVMTGQFIAEYAGLCEAVLEAANPDPASCPPPV